jgi:phage/plasmid-like protein (TIGR03299 family)
MPAGFEGADTMFSAREVPWHRTGTVLPDVATAAEAIVAAGLDWPVEKRPLGYQNEAGLWVPVEDWYSLVRPTDGRVLAPSVHEIYKPFQNIEAFAFVDNITGHTGAKYETGGSLKNGREVFLTVRLENSDFSVAGMDPHETYLLLRTTHDGTGKISVYVVTIRVVCKNTLTWAIAGAKHTWGIRHTHDVEGKVAEARDALKLTARYTTAFEAEAEALLDIKITDDELVHLLRQDLPDAKMKEVTIELMMDGYRTSPTVDGFTGTGWGALNAVSEYVEHTKPNRSGEAAFQRLIDGRDMKLRSTLKQQLLVRA